TRFVIRADVVGLFYDVVNNVVNRATERVYVNDRIALGLRQEEERIEKIRLDGLRQLAAQIPRALAQMPGCEMNLSCLNRFHAKSLNRPSIFHTPHFICHMKYGDGNSTARVSARFLTGAPARLRARRCIKPS